MVKLVTHLLFFACRKNPYRRKTMNKYQQKVIFDFKVVAVYSIQAIVSVFAIYDSFDDPVDSDDHTGLLIVHKQGST